MPSDRDWMVQTVAQARLSRGEPGRISPKVGAVVVNKNGEFLAEAHRGEDPCHKDHAEFYALEKKLSSGIVANATVFTTLEPCFERSEDKIACARRLAERRVGRVVIGMLDPDPSVHGKGQMFLLENGINVQNFDADLTKEILELNRDFIRDRKTPRFSITSHSDNAQVPRGDIRFWGKYKLKPSSSDLYAVFTRKGKTYWPQGRFVIHDNGGWECTTTVNNPGEISILIAQINPDVQLWVQQFLKVGNELDKWVGLEIENLPGGIRVNHQITLKVI